MMLRRVAQIAHATGESLKLAAHWLMAMSRGVEHDASRTAKGRMLLVSHTVPPSWSGQAVILDRLLRRLPEDSFVICCTGEDPRETRTRATEGLGAPFAVLDRRLPPARPVSPLLAVLFRRWRGFRVVWFGTVCHVRGHAIARIAADNNCDRIVGCTGDLADPASAFVAAKRIRVVFLPYYFDDYVEQWPSEADRETAQRVERKFAAASCRAIVPNPFMAEALSERASIHSTVIPNACSGGAGRPLTERSPGTPGIVLYSGAVYHVNNNALCSLAEAVQALGPDRALLRVFTAQSKDALAAAGLHGSHVDIHDHVPAQDITDHQRAADVLVIALNAGGPSAGVVRTSMPAKLGDYLSSGTPILAIAPQDSFVGWYLKEHRCGAVAEPGDTEAVQTALSRMLDDEDLRASVSTAARRCAERDFDAAAGAIALSKAVGITGPESGAVIADSPATNGHQEHVA